MKNRSTVTSTFDDGLSKKSFFDSELIDSKSTSSLKRIAITFICLFSIIAAILSYFLIEYHQAILSLDTQNFAAAKQHFDRLPVNAKYLGEKYAYAEAGILAENGKYLDALIAFDSLHDISIPDSMIDDLAKKIIDNGQSFELLQTVSDFNHISLSAVRTHFIKEDVYQKGQQFYRQGNLHKAKLHFNLLGSYLRSDDYQLLIDLKYENRATPLPIYAHSSVTRLIQIAGFEDSVDLILQSPLCMYSFLCGRWESELEADDILQLFQNPQYKSSKDTRYFEMDRNHSVSHNLPCTWTSGKSYSIANGIYYNDTIEQFRITIHDTNNITIYCYKDSSSHKLDRK